MPDKTEKVFLRSLNGKQPPAFILGNGSPTTLGFVRSLGRRGIPVIAVSAEPGPRVWSRYCLIDRVFDSELALLAFLEHVAAPMPCKGVLIPTGDADVLFLSRNRTKLNQHFRFVLPDDPVLECLASKKSQYEYAASIGIPMPQTHYPQCPEDLQQLADVLRYPCVIKPTYSHLYQNYRRRTGILRLEKAVQVETPEQLYAVYQRMSEAGVDLLVQERINGADYRLFSFYTYLDRNSEALVAFVMQKRRQWPPMYGNGSYSVSCCQDDVVALSLKLLKRIGYRGVANLEFKHDPRDETFKLIEINVRSGARIALALASGVDIPYIAYRDILDEPVARVETYKVGVTWVNLVSDFGAFMHYRKMERLSWREWARSALGANTHAYFARDDPVPFVARLGRVLAWSLRANLPRAAL